MDIAQEWKIVWEMGLNSLWCGGTGRGVDKAVDLL